MVKQERFRDTRASPPRLLLLHRQGIRWLNAVTRYPALGHVGDHLDKPDVNSKILIMN